MSRKRCFITVGAWCHSRASGGDPGVSFGRSYGLAGVSVGAGGSTACGASGAAAVSAGGVGGGGSTGGGGDCEGGGASVGGGGESSGSGGAERAAFSRFCRWRRATFFHARRHRATSMTRRSSLAMAQPYLPTSWTHHCRPLATEAAACLVHGAWPRFYPSWGSRRLPLLSASNGFEDYFFILAVWTY